MSGAAARGATARSSGGTQGFTLVELLVVLVLIGLLVGVVAVSWRSVLPRANLAADIRVIAARISGARSEAISRGSEYFVHIDMTSGEYWLETPFNAKGEFEPNVDQRVNMQRTKLHQGVRFALVTINGEEYADETIQLRFDPLGATDDVTILLHNETFDQYHTIEMLALTGLLRFHEDPNFRRELVDDGDFD
ncbi:prepilin-type N-terminal cleavage/methylation domain-containing protein [Engelhardtia mirabilis]|uniref:prepilin-type N-terminal cleavage/methylation domain-containing protein n=1 Tax=Engelhardtia mirabilis TaxID=2528011 RepID=UPI003AF3B540